MQTEQYRKQVLVNAEESLTKLEEDISSEVKRRV